ncbi:MAG TPA: nucleotide-binding protein, partial [Pyrinomonadaceae bacterium]
MKPRVFIASSTESSEVARALQLELDSWTETTIWSQGVVAPSSTILDDLIRAANNYDFGIFVFSHDDIVRIRSEEFWIARDNIVFELGLFIGEIGKERTFLVLPRNQEKFHLPSDLAGFTPVTYEAQRADQNLRAALGPA